MKTSIRLAALAAALFALPALAAEDAPKIQIAILLDTSSSMDGLIGQAKTQLWKIVNAFTHAQQNGKKPKLEIALYEYGNDGLPAENGYIRQVMPLTTDLDRVSEKLFALKTNGGEEYCGQVIQKAVRNLEWSGSNKDLKLIYIAGNEPFTQGPVDYREAVKQAASKGIVVNTIHCGSEQDGINGHWKDGALLADGNFMIIDQDKTVAYIEAPQDKEIAQLSAELNKTYVGYGALAPAAIANQVAQDNNASGAGMGSALARAATKSSGYYDNSKWDLVDAKKNGKDVSKMKTEELPPEMQKLSAKEREEYVDKLAKDRAEISAKIQKLSADRDAFVAQEMKKRGEADKMTFDSEMVDSVKAQGKKRAFSF